VTIIPFKAFAGADAVIPEHHAAWRNDSTRLSHSPIWFQLAKIRLTVFGSPTTKGSAHIRALSPSPNRLQNCGRFEWTAVDSSRTDGDIETMMRNDFDQNSCAINQLTKYQKAGSTPAASTNLRA
jgi:hypothetical protein